MAIQLDERFVVRAPPEPVWRFLVDPRCVVTCVPGGELAAVLDERTFDGRVRVAAGPFTFAYGGRIRLAEVDETARRVKIVGAARDTAGTDAAQMTLESSLAALPGGGTEVVARARIDVEGPIVEIGRGVLEQLGHEVFQDFASRVARTVERGEAAVATDASPPSAAPSPGKAEPVRAIPLVLRAIGAWIAGWRRAPAAHRTEPRSPG